MPIDDSSHPSASVSPPLDWPILPHVSPDRPTLPRYLFIAGTATPGPAISAQAEEARCARIQQAALKLDGHVERLASPFGDAMIYTICQLPSNRAAASFATIMRAAYATGVRTVALPKPRRRVTYLTSEPPAQVVPSPPSESRPPAAA